MTELTGLDVSNASHYDGRDESRGSRTGRTQAHGPSETSWSLAPCILITGKRYATYLAGTPYKIEELGFDGKGNFQIVRNSTAKLDATVAGLIFQTPNFFGLLENLDGVSEKIHTNGSLLILTRRFLCRWDFSSRPGNGARTSRREKDSRSASPWSSAPLSGLFCDLAGADARIPGRWRA